VDLFYALGGQKSVDLTSIAPVAALTGGDLLVYSPFDAARHGEKLHYDIFRVLTRNQASECAIKARTSTGLTVTEYFGGFGFKEQADFELAGFDSDKVIGFILRNDEKLKEDTLSFVQFAFMYTNQYGQRRIRVFNYQLQIAKNLSAYYKAADCETLAQFMLKKETAKVMVRGAKATREAIINSLVTLLHVYRQKCAAQTAPS
jgi:protein transport protein SEC24